MELPSSTLRFSFVTILCKLHFVVPVDQINYQDALNILHPPPPPKVETPPADEGTSVDPPPQKPQDSRPAVPNNQNQPRMPDRSNKPALRNIAANNSPRNLNENTSDTKEKVFVQTIHNDLSKTNKLNNNLSNGFGRDQIPSSPTSNGATVRTQDTMPAENTRESVGKKSNSETSKVVPLPLPKVPDRTLKPANPPTNKEPPKPSQIEIENEQEMQKKLQKLEEEEKELQR